MQNNNKPYHHEIKSKNKTQIVKDKTKYDRKQYKQQEIELMQTSEETILNKSKLNHYDKIGVLKLPNDISKEKIERFKKEWLASLASAYRTSEIILHQTD